RYGQDGQRCRRPSWPQPKWDGALWAHLFVGSPRNIDILLRALLLDLHPTSPPSHTCLVMKQVLVRGDQAPRAAKNTRHPRVIVIGLCMALAAATTAAGAQQYPTRPVRLVVPFTAGSATDILARLIGPKLNESWGHQVIVDNRPSAGGTVAGGIVAGAPPDGHTLMLTSSVFAGAAALYSKLPYDTLKDFAGITQIASTPLVIVVAPGSGVKTVK